MRCKHTHTPLVSLNKVNDVLSVLRVNLLSLSVKMSPHVTINLS